MSYDATAARSDLIAALGRVDAHLAAAVDALGVAYDTLDEQTAGRLESELFGPIVKASGRVRRTAQEFAARFALTVPERPSPAPVSSRRPVRELITRSADSVAHADAELAAVQDSGQAIEVGDADLRAGLSATRVLLATVPQSARSLLGTLGR